MDIIIRNSQELKDEIARLEDLKKRQSEVLRRRFGTPKFAFESVMSILPNTLRPNYFGMASRIVVPFVLNKTIFRNSNFLVRGLVGLVSQKAASYISEESAERLWTKLKSLFNKHQYEKKRSISLGHSVSGNNHKLRQHA